MTATETDGCMNETAPTTPEVVLITAAATGICREVAAQLAAHGCRLILVDSDAVALATAAAELGSAVVASWAVDVRDENAVRAAYATLAAADRPTVLVNGVGGDARPIPVTELDTATVRASFEHNLVSAFLMTQVCVPEMKERGHGRLVFLASIAGRTYSVFSNAAYVAAKAAVVGFMKQCSWELAAHGITANAVAHGPIMTDRIEQAWASKSDDAKHEILSRIPLGRRGSVAEAAHFVVPFCIGAPGFATGAVLDVNGGLMV